MTSMSGAFDFVENGRTYTCHVEAPRPGRAEVWWWFGVSGDDARYAPFQAVAGDTPASVRPRVVAYYEERLARRGWALPQERGAVAPAARVAGWAASRPAADAPSVES